MIKCPPRGPVGSIARRSSTLPGIAVLLTLAALANIAMAEGADQPPFWDAVPTFAAVEDVPVTVDLRPYVGDPDTPVDELTLECETPGTNVSGFNVTTVFHVGGEGSLIVVLRDHDNSSSAKVVFNVEDVNDAPRMKVVQLPDGMVDEVYSFILRATDEDDAPDELVFSDDTPLFGIGRNGSIAFRPDSADLGYHTFCVTVTDPHGASDTKELALFIAGDCPAPYIPCIGPFRAYVGQPFVLDLDEPEPPQLIPPEFWPNYTWSIDSDKFTINQTEGLFVWDSPRGPDVGDNYFKITLQEEYGRYWEQEIKVTVYDLVPPVAEAGPDITVGQREPFTLDARGSSDDGGLVRWSFSYLHGGKMRVLEGETVVLALEDAGAYRFMLQVEDHGGNLANDTVLVQVLDTEAPIASATCGVPVGMYEPSVLDGSGSKDNVGIVTHRWAFDEGGSMEELYGAVVEVRFVEAGTHHVRLEVVDAAGLASTTMLAVVVLDNALPRADAGRNIVTRPLYLTGLDAGASTDNVGIVSYRWDVSGPDGPFHLDGVWVALTLERPGTYYVRLTVADAAGNEAVDEKIVEVAEKDPEDERTSLVPIQETIAPVLLVAVLAAIVLLRRWASHR